MQQFSGDKYNGIIYQYIKPKPMQGDRIATNSECDYLMVDERPKFVVDNLGLVHLMEINSLNFAMRKLTSI
jgi:hypothetical protein